MKNSLSAEFMTSERHSNFWLYYVNYLIVAPSTTRELPEDYVERVKQVHESGGYGSRG